MQKNEYCAFRIQRSRTRDYRDYDFSYGELLTGGGVMNPTFLTLHSGNVNVIILNGILFRCCISTITSSCDILKRYVFARGGTFMGEQTEEKKPGKRICAGLLAHVDAGKTTLAEGILYAGGEIHRAGRVDHRDTFLDTDVQERERGITIYSKQARFCWKSMQAVLLDTPGHADFSAEMERTLQVLDCAVLIISGADGVQGHTLTLWRLLQRYQIPVFIFLNKLDQPGCDAVSRLEELRKRLDGSCVLFGGAKEYLPDISAEQFRESVAVCDEELLERYLEWEERASDQGQEQCPVNDEEIRRLIAERRIFPCYAGSALKQLGVEELLDGLERYGSTRVSGGEGFGARVFKISRDEQGNRLTHIRVMGGELRVKQLLGEEKIDQIRLYSGSRYELAKEVQEGEICALTGPVKTCCGQGFGVQAEAEAPVLTPVMTYRVLLPEKCDVHQAYLELAKLEEEEPQLHLVWDERLGELHVQLMGEVQTEILKRRIREQFGLEVSFDQGNVVYRETIADVTEGVGHFEPLRHYAEVHLVLEPLERGSGLQFASCCSEDELDRNWQRLVLSHLEETVHPGVLTGSPITDMRITLAAGRAHTKHTEGGDFRQATYRAVRQGLCRAKNILLEPVYEFRLELPQSAVGRAMTDIRQKGGRFEAPEMEGEAAFLTGVVPVSQMYGYQTELMAYTGGRGRLFTSLKGYEPCRNAAEIIESIGYDAARDLEHPCSSVFCSHGAGVVVEWDQVEEYMHLESALTEEFRLANGSRYGAAETKQENYGEGAASAQRIMTGRSVQEELIGQDEIEEILQRTYGRTSRVKPGWAKTIRASQKEFLPRHQGRQTPQEEYLLVDGYNILFGWESLRELARENLDGARGRLMDILCNYQGYRKIHLILVFDAYKVKGNPGSIIKYHNIDVVYTKEAETADQYIEKTAHQMSRDCRIRVATSDGLEQLIILGAGAIRVSAREFEKEVMETCRELREEFLDNPQRKRGERRLLLEGVSPEVEQYLKEMADPLQDGGKD